MVLCCMSEDTLEAHQIPYEFREPAIHCGYRRPGLSFSACIRSLFTLHNETFNVWTHLISFSFYVYYTYTLPLDLWLPENQSVLCLLITCYMFPLGSALAHLFMSMSPVIRHVCFMVDYLAISLYAFGAAVTNKVYALPRSWKGGFFENYYLTGMFVGCFACIFVSCYTRFLPRTRSTKILRLSAFGIPYLYGMLPCMYRALYCEDDSSCEGAAYYAQHFLDTIFTVLFYGGHIPEVLFPGYFDVFFQSHTLFHIVVVVGTFHHLQGNLVDKATRPIVDFSPMPCSPMLPLLALAIVNALMIIYFGIKIVDHIKRTTSITNSLHNHKQN